MKLPNYEKAIVDDAKLLDYCLDPEHKIGKHKARVFQSALHINLDNFYILKNAILKAVLTEHAVFTNKIAYGDLYPTFPTPKLENSIYGTYRLTGL